MVPGVYSFQVVLFKVTWCFKGIELACNLLQGSNYFFSINKAVRSLFAMQ